MATTFRSSTPPAPSSIRTPTTPRFGFDDDYQPYSPRKSARVSQRSRAAQTPPPMSQHNRLSSPTPRKTISADTDTTTSLSSPPTATKKRTPRASPTMAGRRVSGALNFEGTASAAASLGLPAPKNTHQSRAATRTSMLPTPDKTPKKAPAVVSSKITSIARNLFPARAETIEEAMPSPKKKGKKRFTGFTLDSFEAEDESASPIQIYTDSHDRVPEVDLSSDNPFYGDAGVTRPDPTKRASKRRKINVPGEGEQTVEELEQREDGLICVFRGRKVFRKFADMEDHQSVQEDEGDEADYQLADSIPPSLRRPLTRSSVKPRLLFPTAQQVRDKEAKMHTTEDEEADTDIDESMIDMSTPMDKANGSVSTPKAPRFAPASPPTTVRATRSKKVELSSSPAGPTSDDEHLHSPQSTSSRGSPFASWPRVKGRVPSSKKRDGGALDRLDTKKQKTRSQTD